MNDEALQQVRKAYHVACSAHDGQKRASGDPYIQHPLEVARLLGEFQLDIATIQAAILHDVVEDSEMSSEQIAAKFGDTVALLVDGVSKIEQLEFTSREQLDAANLRKMLIAVAQDARVILIKLADRLHNMRTLSALSKEKINRIATSTLRVYAPVAKRVGLYHWAGELENWSFSYLYPRRYRAIQRKLNEMHSRRKRETENLIQRLKTSFNENQMEVEISSRNKSVYSTYVKMREKNRPLSHIQDLIGIRILVADQNSSYQALGIVHARCTSMPNHFKDYISSPKHNGYQSLHTKVLTPGGFTAEVQIRSNNMHYFAERGIAAHLNYKEKIHHKAQSNVMWLEEFFATQRHPFSARDFMDHLHTSLQEQHVYVFTPQGQIKELNRNATIIDFAYAVHTQIGHHAHKAYVNDQWVPLTTPLKNADRVRIETGKKPTVNVTWLNYVYTSKARSAIRQFISTRREEDVVEWGKHLLRSAMRKQGRYRGRIYKQEREKLQALTQAGSWDEVLFKIGSGARDAKVLSFQLIQDKPQHDKVQAYQALTISGAEGLSVRFARCCRPVAGDSIIGITSKEKGLVVHRHRCSLTRNKKIDPSKCVPLIWSEKTASSFHSEILIEIRNRPGMLAKIGDTIANTESNILQAQLATLDQNHQKMELLLEVKDRNHLARIIWRLNRLTDVIQIKRALS